MTRTLLSFGHGYSAQALTRLLLPQGWTLIGTTRSAEKAGALAGMGITTTSGLGALAISLIGLANIVGTVLAGYLGKRFTKKYLLA
ncbi:MAG: hypothetical protein AAFY39_03805, partial [Pseudomonadota bacterium]